MTDLLDAVMERYHRYDFNAFTARDVAEALKSEN